jgi:hypothetical protein
MCLFYAARSKHWTYAGRCQLLEARCRAAVDALRASTKESPRVLAGASSVFDRACTIGRLDPRRRTCIAAARESPHA